MKPFTAALISLLVEAFLLSQVKKHSQNGNILIAGAFFAAAITFYFTVQDSSRHIKSGLKEYTTFAWLSVIVVLACILFQIHSGGKDDITQTLRSWNEKTRGLLCFAFIASSVITFSSNPIR